MLITFSKHCLSTFALLEPIQLHCFHEDTGFIFVGGDPQALYILDIFLITDGNVAQSTTDVKIVGL